MINKLNKNPRTSEKRKNEKMEGKKMKIGTGYEYKKKREEERLGIRE